MHYRSTHEREGVRMTPEEIEKMQKDLETERANAKALANKNDRLEEESRKNKTRAQTAEEEIEEAKKKKLQDDGKLEELLATERAEKLQLSQELKDRDNKIIKSNLRAEVMKYAKDAHSVERLLSVTEHKDLLKVNEDLTVEGGEAFVTKCRETDNFLFKKKSLDDTEDKKPNPNNNEKGEGYLAELDACTSSKELNAVKQKYGKL